MNYQQILLLLLSSSLHALVVNSFSVSIGTARPLNTAAMPKFGCRQGSTCLFAEETDENAQEGDEEKKATSTAASDSTDILSSPAFLKRKIDVLKSDISKAEEDLEEANKAVEAGKAEWGPQLDELQKEYKLIQERMSTQSKKGNTIATVEVVRNMLSVLDNFDRAFGAVAAETEEEKAIEAEFKQAYGMILNTFKELGVTEIETVGKEFDFQYHQAVMQRPHEDFEEGIVCDELQKGFVIGETLIRAAMVAVAA